MSQCDLEREGSVIVLLPGVFKCMKKNVSGATTTSKSSRRKLILLENFVFGSKLFDRRIKLFMDVDPCFLHKGR